MPKALVMKDPTAEGGLSIETYCTQYGQATSPPYGGDNDVLTKALMVSAAALGSHILSKE